ncbi:hypothetical protein [Desulfoluna sp.]|uniref:hypothetical protein n=1 Tax=Desulfoluna sp. TaxID=2045199 RepID=UPI00260BD39F|nr:hypothetical protein [Desulfoluna sp.]
MEELIFNIFLISQNNFIKTIGVKTRVHKGTDQEKINFLQKNVESDINNLTEFPIPDRYQIIDPENSIIKGVLRSEKYQDLCDVGKSYEIFGDIFNYYNSVENPLMCVSIIVDGKLSIDKEVPVYINDKDVSEIHLREPQNYLDKYSDYAGFHIDKLIEDDFLNAVSMLIKSGHYIEGTKLLLSSIDSFAFLELGDVRNNFIIWIENHLNLQKLNITAQELWELRNSLLHMTNYESRRVIKGDVTRLIVQAGYLPDEVQNETNTGKYLNIHKFYAETNNAVENWLLETIQDPKKLKTFINRYNLIVSNARFTKIEFIE